MNAILELTEDEPVVIEHTPRTPYQQPPGRRWPHMSEEAEAIYAAARMVHPTAVATVQCIRRRPCYIKRIGFYPPCASMVDKILFATPSDSVKHAS